MKRCIFFIICLLCCYRFNAQNTYTYQYWFDNTDENIYTVNFSGNIFQADLDVRHLTDGIHSLNYHIMDTSYNWSSPQSYMFVKMSLLGQGLAEMGDDLTCHYWFNQDDENKKASSFGNGIFTLDVSELTDGIHTLNIIIEGEMYSSPQSYMFVKMSSLGQGLAEMGDDLTCHYWFDQDEENKMTSSFGNGIFTLDVSELTDGIHTLNIILEGEMYSSPQSYMFVKMSSLGQGLAEMGSELSYIYWFDKDHDKAEKGSLSNGIYVLDVDTLNYGVHTFNIMLKGEMYSSPQSYMFAKLPIQYQDTIIRMIDKWEYWINEDYDSRIISKLTPTLDSLSIISLLAVEPQEIRSNCFHFVANDGEPYINAKNQINFRFWTVDKHLLEMNDYYIDDKVKEEIDAELIEPNTTTEFPKPDSNDIKWFKLIAQVGDSLSFKADKACSLQLFSPSGEEVFGASGPESIKYGGCYAWEDGYYYLAVHDAHGSNENISLTYQFIHKYAVLSWNVRNVGNGGVSTITLQGNGFNSLIDACLVNDNNDTIKNIYIYHDKNTTTTLSFDFFNQTLGEYDLVADFYDETIKVNDFLTVEYPIEIELVTDVSYASSFLRGSASTYTYIVTNKGNMSAYAIPLYMYISTPNDCIKRIDIEGLGLKSIIADWNLDSLSPHELEAYKQWADEMGDTHYFFTFHVIDEETGEPMVVKSNYFFVNFAPNETKVIKVHVELDCMETVYVWMTPPSDPIPPYFGPGGGNFDDGDSGGDGDDGSGGDGDGEPDDSGDGGSDDDDSGDDGSGGDGDDDDGGSGGDSNSGGESGGNDYSGSSGNMGGYGDANPYCCVVDQITCFLNILCGGLDIADLILGFAPNTPITAIVSVSSCVCNAVSILNSKLNDFVCENDSFNVNIFDMSVMEMGSWIGAIGSCVSAIVPGGNVDRIGKLLSAVSLGITAGNIITIIDDCKRAFTEPKPNCFNGNPVGGGSTPVNSSDPNDIYGYTAESGSKFMRQDIQKINYEIEFENDTTLANAAAHTIVVTDTLDANRFDLASFSAHGVTIGEKILHLNGEQNFVYTLDLRPEIYVIAQIQQEYDVNTGIIKWTISSLDPMTMEPTTDPDQGALPVNYYGDGVGTLNYSVRLKDYFDDGTEISNRACIVFDLEAAIVTPTWTNIVDAVNPTSQIEEAVPFADSLRFVFNSEDNRSGVWYHTLYHRNDSTNMEWDVLKTRIFEDSYTMKLESLQNSEYLVMATDSAGNNETKTLEPEYLFTLDSLNYYELLAYSTDEKGDVTGSGIYVEGSDIEIESIPTEGYHFVQWNDFTNDNPKTVHLTQDTTFIAQFAINQYDVTLAVQDSLMGTVSGAGIYEHNEVVNVVADENKGYVFLYWLESDTIVSTEAEFSFEIKCDRNLIAVFGPADAHYTMLKEGWNWYSTYIDFRRDNGFEKLTDGLDTNGEVIKSQTQFVTYYDGYDTWDGSLTEVDNKNMYMIDMSTEHYLMMEGVISNVSQTSMTLKPGWNWISYPIDKTQTLTRSLKDFTPKDGDYFKSQTGYATYYEGYGWDGSLLSLEPGQGYMYMNNDTVEKTLTYSKSYIRKNKVNNVTTDGNHWKADVNKYPNNMNVTAVVAIDGTELMSGDLEIGVFANGECRGSAKAVYKEMADRYVFFLTIYGEGDEELTFKLYDALLDVEYLETSEIMTFNVDATIGNINNPYIINYATVSVEDNEVELVDNIYPNPVNVRETVYLNKNYEKVEVINSLGITVKSYYNVNKIDGIREPGVYIIKTFEGKTIVHNKLIVK